MFATESVSDGISPDEVVSDVVEMVREDEPFVTDAELAAEDQELSDGYESEGDAVASDETEVQVAASRPSKVGVGSRRTCQRCSAVTCNVTQP